MPTVIHIRGVPGTGKHTTARILERDLGWPRIWVHHFDSTYRAIGSYKVPRLTTELMDVVALHLMRENRDFIFVRPDRDASSVGRLSGEVGSDYKLVPVRLTASYANLVARVTRRQCGNESPFRLTTKEALDEYLQARPESEFPGEHVIDTDKLTPEQVAGKIKELL